MSAMTNYLEQAIGDHLFRDTSYTMPETYVCLLTAAAGEASAGTECANAGAYARTRIYTDTSTAPYWTAYSAGTYDNNSDCTFPTASASWGTVVAFKIADSGTYGGGNDLIYGNLSSSKTVDTNDTFKFATGDLDVTLD